MIIDSTSLHVILKPNGGSLAYIASLKGINFIFVPRRKGTFLSHILLTSNHHDTIVSPNLLSSLQGRGILFALGDAAYDSENIHEATEEIDIFFVSLMNLRNGTERKDAYGHVIPDFLKTRLVKWLFGLRNTIERVFNQLLEQPRWYRFRRYQLHVQLFIIMHNVEFLL